MRFVLRVSAAAAAAAVLFVGARMGVSASAQRSGVGQPAAAAMQQPPPRSWYSVNIVTVKRESVAEWREFQKTQTIPMQQKGGVKQRDTYQSGAPFGDGNTFAIVTPIDKFEDYDKPPLVARVLSGDALQAYQKKNASLTESNRMFAIQDRVELSIAPASTAKIAGIILTDVTVTIGHEQQYEAYLRNDLLPVLKKGNVPGYLVSRTVFGGNASEYHTAQLFESYSDIDKGPVTRRVLGAAGTQALNAKMLAHVSSINRTILRYVPDLSFARRPMS
jgi:hypothetical protein